MPEEREIEIVGVGWGGLVLGWWVVVGVGVWVWWWCWG